MSKDIDLEHLCELCGTPMPEGEPFRYHGFSSDCPKPYFSERLDSPTVNKKLIVVDNPIGKDNTLDERIHKILTDHSNYDKLYFDTERIKELIQSICMEVLGDKPTEDESSDHGICFSEGQFGKLKLWKKQRQTLQSILGIRSGK